MAGLFFHEKHKRLWPDWGVGVLCEDRLAAQPREYIEDLNRLLLSPLAGAEPRVVRESVFSYRFKMAEGSAFSSAWILEFYGRIPFLGMVVPSDIIRAKLEGTEYAAHRRGGVAQVDLGTEGAVATGTILR